MYKNIENNINNNNKYEADLATLNIGNLTFTHRGDSTYSGTAYSKNDGVLFNEW